MANTTTPARANLFTASAAGAACTAGIFIGDTALYSIGRFLGRKAIRKAPLKWLLKEHAKALNAAQVFEIDDVIDPAETRAWLLRGLNATPPTAPRQGKKRPFVDTW